MSTATDLQGSRGSSCNDIRMVIRSIISDPFVFTVYMTSEKGGH